MKGAIDLTKSERGVFAIVIVVCATVLVAIGKLGGDDWASMVKVLSVALILGKTFRPSGQPGDDPVTAPIPQARVVPSDEAKL
jgi:hypothetical protein